MSEPQNPAETAPQPAGEAIDFDALRQVRGEKGRFVAGFPGPRLDTGERARTLLEVPALAAVHADEVNAILVDLGGRDNVSRATLRLVERLASATMFAEQAERALFEGGLFTAKGRGRAAGERYERLVSLQLKLAQAIGLERRQKQAPDLAAVLSGDE